MKYSRIFENIPQIFQNVITSFKYPFNARVHTKYSEESPPSMDLEGGFLHLKETPPNCRGITN
jgi:hypothetical protein